MPSQHLHNERLHLCRAPVKILPNMERREALKLLDQEGTLLVISSLVDNMPYVLAEAAVNSTALASELMSTYIINP